MRKRNPASGMLFGEYLNRLRRMIDYWKRFYRLTVLGKARSIPRSVPLVRIASWPARSGGLVIVAGFHCTEPAGPLCLVHYLHHILGRALDLGVPLTLYPVVNPYGFDYRKRSTVDGGYTNAGFIHAIDSTGPEAALLRKDMERVRPRIFLDLHEDVETKRSYLYVLNGQPKLVRNLVKALGRLVPLVADKETIHDPQIIIHRGVQVETGRLVVHGGVIRNHHDGSSEDFMSHQPGVVGSFAVETPTRGVSIELRMAAHLAVIDAALDFLA